MSRKGRREENFSSVEKENSPRHSTGRQFNTAATRWWTGGPPATARQTASRAACTSRASRSGPSCPATCSNRATSTRGAPPSSDKARNAAGAWAGASKAPAAAASSKSASGLSAKSRRPAAGTTRQRVESRRRAWPPSSQAASVVRETQKLPLGSG